MIAMPVCPKARCRVKPVKGHRGQGVLWEARDFNTGSQRAGVDGKGGSQSWVVACLRRRETEAGG